LAELLIHKYCALYKCNHRAKTATFASRIVFNTLQTSERTNRQADRINLT